MDLMATHALQYANIFQGEEVMDIRPGDPITVLTSRRRFLAKAVLLATGASYRHLGAPGESRLSGHGVSYCSTCDGPLFKGKKVVIVGGGNSAVTEALHLHNIGVQVTIVHRRDTLRAQEHLTKNIFANKIPVLFDTEIKEIRGKDRVEEVLLYNVEDERDETHEGGRRLYRHRVHPHGGTRQETGHSAHAGRLYQAGFASPDQHSGHLFGRRCRRRVQADRHSRRSGCGSGARHL